MTNGGSMSSFIRTTHKKTDRLYFYIRYPTAVTSHCFQTIKIYNPAVSDTLRRPVRKHFWPKTASRVVPATEPGIMLASPVRGTWRRVQRPDRAFGATRFLSIWTKKARPKPASHDRSPEVAKYHSTTPYTAASGNHDQTPQAQRFAGVKCVVKFVFCCATGATGY